MFPIFLLRLDATLTLQQKELTFICVSTLERNVCDIRVKTIQLL